MRMLRRMNRAQIDTLYVRLLEHHKLLLDVTRAEYEREHGRVEHAGAFLQLLIHAEPFAWLQPMTALLVELDDPELTPDVATARAKVERLFSPETPKFHPRHLEVVATQSETLRSHARTMQLLASLAPAN